MAISHRIICYVGATALVFLLVFLTACTVVTKQPLLPTHYDSAEGGGVFFVKIVQGKGNNLVEFMTEGDGAVQYHSVQRNEVVIYEDAAGQAYLTGNELHIPRGGALTVVRVP